MTNPTNLARTAVLIVFAIFCGKAVSQTTFYIDPSFSGAGRNGSAAAPWQSMNDSGASSAINSALASNNVTVYFSASQTQSSTLSLSRTDGSTHVLTLNGTEMVNANDGVNNAVTSWKPGVTLTPCVGYRCAANGAWIGHQYTVSAGIAISGPNSVNNCIGYFDVRGFKFVSGGQIAVLTYIHDLTFEYNEDTVNNGTIGPGVYIGAGQHGPCNASTSTAGGPDNVVMQYNWTHKTYGECIYDGASTSDPPGGPGNSEYTANGMTCGTNCNTGAHHRILYNTNEDCAYWGGQGDGTDIKDGHADLWFRGNTNRPSVDSPAGQGGAMGMVTEASAIIDGNYFEDPGSKLCNGIRVADSWYNFAGRQDQLIIRNNIVNGFKSGACNNYGIYLTSPDYAQSLAYWTTPISIYNNTVYNTGNSCISLSSSSLDGSAVANVENNICDGTSGGVSGASTHDYNDYFNAKVTCPVSGESHSLCVDPLFMSTASPYSASSFMLQSASPVASVGIDLASIFTDDYLNDTRATPWDFGAFGSGASATAPAAPTGLVAVVN